MIPEEEVRESLRRVLAAFDLLLDSSLELLEIEDRIFEEFERHRRIERGAVLPADYLKITEGLWIAWQSIAMGRWLAERWLLFPAMDYAGYRREHAPSRNT